MKYPQIFIGSLSDYANGYLTGEWVKIKPKIKKEQFINIVKEVIEKTSITPTEEYLISDYSFFGCKLEQYEDLSLVYDKALLSMQYGPVFEAYCKVFGWENYLPALNIETIKADIDNHFCGDFELLEDFAEQYLDDCGILEQIPEGLIDFFDFKQYGDSLLMSSFDMARVENSLYFFSMGA
jgi:antirestriction protein